MGARQGAAGELGLQQGAQPTERVAKLLEISGAMEQYKAAK